MYLLDLDIPKIDFWKIGWGEEKPVIDIIQNFPKQGVSFLDTVKFMQEHTQNVVELFGESIKMFYTIPDVVIGIEARGFILGAALANYFYVPFIPIRKHGKLANRVSIVEEEYDTEYSKDKIEMYVNTTDKRSAIIVDDVLATGGTMKAAVSLSKKQVMMLHAHIL